MYVKEVRILPWKDWRFNYGGFLARMGYSAERAVANMEALEKEERNPTPNTYTHDLLFLELRSGGRGLGQARAINTGRGVGVSGYPEAAAVPVRERDGKRHVALTVCVNVSHSSFCHHRSLGPYPSLWVSLSLSLMVSGTHSLKVPVPPPQDSVPPHSWACLSLSL